MAILRHEISSGWTFKQKDDDSENPWLPVPKIPSQVHVDLLANNK